MKRATAFSGATFVLASALLLSGCGSTNNFGASVDIQSICAFEQGESDGICQSNPVVSAAFNAPLNAELDVINRMSDSTSASGLTVRLAMMEVSYRTPFGQTLPVRRQQLAENVSPGDSVLVPVTLFSYEQIAYIQANRSLFPEYPFQVNLKVVVNYDTTGGSSGTVERLFTLELTE